jgi:hypothetical protein
MLEKLSRFWRQPKLGLALALLIALSFNNWLLGIDLNRRLFDKDGSVSEFSALTQPHYWVFRSLDITSGILMVLLALYTFRQLVIHTKPLKYLIYGTTVLGLANIVDAILPLRCSETLNTSCNIPVVLSLTHYQMPSHAYSSVIIAVCYLILPVAALIYATLHKMKILMVFSALAAAVALESLLSAVFQYLSENSFTVKTSGAGQEFQMIILGLWFIVWGWSIYKHPRVNLQKVTEISSS